ncbi:RHTO0S07e03224g1_1 [Rhodotorula toruloides]|uniref:RHTO0S07e03224g1_1 n=2 Tax=Rhodotorula toruloides TaxID=5286 RepID=A0A061B744_RHOTO|nr:uncharacterized protein RHTO_02806 [Rhodotorula toruloides NP11]EMS25079.1 hypothetical protein RHTO_02806 [Rhodotorula toruloides NP11]CDR42715.1 RHTO0S07e03224g1_1 [Rhodotorula toruloides]
MSCRTQTTTRTRACTARTRSTRSPRSSRYRFLPSPSVRRATSPPARTVRARRPRPMEAGPLRTRSPTPTRVRAPRRMLRPSTSRRPPRSFMATRSMRRPPRPRAITPRRPLSTTARSAARRHSPACPSLVLVSTCSATSPLLLSSTVSRLPPSSPHPSHRLCIPTRIPSRIRRPSRPPFAA